MSAKTRDGHAVSQLNLLGWGKKFEIIHSRRTFFLLPVKNKKGKSLNSHSHSRQFFALLFLHGRYFCDILHITGSFVSLTPRKLKTKIIKGATIQFDLQYANLRRKNPSEYLENISIFLDSRKDVTVNALSTVF